MAVPTSHQAAVGARLTRLKQTACEAPAASVATRRGGTTIAVRSSRRTRCAWTAGTHRKYLTMIRPHVGIWLRWALRTPTPGIDSSLGACPVTTGARPSTTEASAGRLELRSTSQSPDPWVVLGPRSVDPAGCRRHRRGGITGQKFGARTACRWARLLYEFSESRSALRPAHRGASPGPHSFAGG